MSNLLDYEVRKPIGEPAGLVVLTHGRGADQFDLIPLLEALDPERRLLGVFPRGPLKLAPGGAHWYVVKQVGFPDDESFQVGFNHIAQFVDGLADEFGVPLERTVLGGFSQGAVMSYAVGLGYGRPSPAGILAISGFIPTVDELTLDLSNREGLPVAIRHGSFDPVIGVEFGRHARDRLTAADLAIDYEEAPAEHEIPATFIPRLQQWLKERLP